MSDFILPNRTPVALVDCVEAFNALTDLEKIYAHSLSKACFYGALIVLPQTSLESSLIFVLLHMLFKAQPVSELKQIALQNCNFSENEIAALLVYAAGIFCYNGNYIEYGDKKFIPGLPKEKFRELLMKSKAFDLEPEKMQSLISRCIEKIFSLEDKERNLGFPDIGTTAYLSKNYTKEDHKVVTDFFKEKGFHPENTRLFKTLDETGSVTYEVRLASVLQTEDEEENSLVSSHMVGGHKFSVTRGDYSKLLKKVNRYLHIAKGSAANENEVKMIENYIRSFHTGSVEAHKEGSRYWVKDKGPIIETYIGFIEQYRDPAGMRAEFEGFVAVVNKKMSEKFINLVRAATKILPLLPWPSEYEKDKFLQPDFTSLDILTYGASGIPNGKCVPNYGDIRQYEGFKNISLGNIILSRISKDANFLKKEDKDLLRNYFMDAYELNVGLHELLGHGSGKLFQKLNDGTFNFDVDDVKHLETGEKISKWYKANETYDSVFGSLGCTYEECRAECVALYLATERDVLKIFGYEGEQSEHILFCFWLNIVCRGIEALEKYEPLTKKWSQAHCQADYVILQVCLEAGDGFVNIERIQDPDGNPDLLFTMDYDKIRTVGKNAIGSFLRKLQLYRATADVSSAEALFGRYSVVAAAGDAKYPFLDYREIAMAKKKPRVMHVQANTVIRDGKVHLVNYEPTHEGLIQSCIDRYQDDESIYDILEEIWAKDKPHF